MRRITFGPQLKLCAVLIFRHPVSLVVSGYESSLNLRNFYHQNIENWMIVGEHQQRHLSRGADYLLIGGAH